jgi:hypothetical protein
MRDGAKYFELDSEDVVSISPELIANASYVRFEYLPAGCELQPEEARMTPALAVRSNRDTEADGLPDLQQCVGFQVMPRDLPRFEEEISSVVSSMVIAHLGSAWVSRAAAGAWAR